MANFFDQFDEAPGTPGNNFFDQFDEAKKAPAVGVSDETAMGQRGLAKGTVYPKEVQDQDAMKATASWPARFAAGIVGLPGDIDQTARNLDTWVPGKIGMTNQPPSETKLPTQASLMERGRGWVSPGAADTFLHEAFTPAGKTVETTLDLVSPGLSKFTGKGRRALEGGVERLDMGKTAFKNMVDQAYGRVASAGVGYDPANYNAWTSGILRSVGNSNLSPRVRALVDKLSGNKMVQRLGGNPIYADELEETFKEAGGMLAKGTDNDRRILTQIRTGLDDFRRNSPTVTGNMSGAEAVSRYEKAREIAQRQMKANKLAKIEVMAQNLPSGKANQKVDAEINKILSGRTPLNAEDVAQLQKVGGNSFMQDMLTGGGVPGIVGRTTGGALLGGASGYASGGDPMSAVIGAGLGAVGSAASGRFGDRMGARRRANQLQVAQQMARVGPHRVTRLREGQASNQLIQAILLGGALPVEQD